MHDINFQLNETASGGMFYVGSKANPDAQLDFSNTAPGIISADSTEVKPELRGQEIAKKLVIALIDYAKEENLKIIPVCSYVQLFFKRNKEFQSVLAAEADRK